MKFEDNLVGGDMSLRSSCLGTRHSKSLALVGVQCDKRYLEIVFSWERRNYSIFKWLADTTYPKFTHWILRICLPSSLLYRACAWRPDVAAKQEGRWLFGWKNKRNGRRVRLSAMRHMDPLCKHFGRNKRVLYFTQHKCLAVEKGRNYNIEAFLIGGCFMYLDRLILTEA